MVDDGRRGSAAARVHFEVGPRLQRVAGDERRAPFDGEAIFSAAVPSRLPQPLWAPV